MTHYVIHGGLAGKERMEVVARAFWPTTRLLLERAGIREGINCLDLGCGAGEVTFKIAEMIGPKGRVLGMDMDKVKLGLGRERAEREGVRNIEFREANVFEWGEESAYDLIYVRFLLTHLPGSERVVPKLIRALRPGGGLAVEDIEMVGFVCHPANRAAERCVDLYRKVVLRRGGDPDIGPKLLGMLAGAGLQEAGVSVVYPDNKEDSGKRIAVLTLIGISDALLQEKLIEGVELCEAIAELDRFTRDSHSVLCGPRVFQVWGRRAVA